MWNPSPKRRRTTAAVGMLAVALALAVGMGSAFAQEDEDDLPLDTKLLRKFMKELGFKRSEEGIEYRERAPLVVPPSRDLPPPRAEGPADRNPAWPKDPDVVRRREATAAEKAKLRSTADQAYEDSRPLRPDELSGRGRTGSTASSRGPAAQSAEDASRPMSPSQLGSGTTQNFFQGMLSSFGPARPESAPFTSEPPRTSMTAPPQGYQTPSPNYPYGITGQTAQSPTPAPGLEKRLEPPK